MVIVVNALDIFLYFLNGLNPALTAAFISTFNSFIAVCGSLLGAILGSALTLYFTGHNQRKHLEREIELKQKKELEEQKQMLLLILMETWKAAIQEAMDFHTFILLYKRSNNISDTFHTVPPGDETSERLNKIFAHGENMRLQECKYLFYLGETETYKEIKDFHQNLINYALVGGHTTKEKSIVLLNELHMQRDKLVLIFRQVISL